MREEDSKPTACHSDVLPRLAQLTPALCGAPRDRTETSSTPRLSSDDGADADSRLQAGQGQEPSVPPDPPAPQRVGVNPAWDAERVISSVRRERQPIEKKAERHNSKGRAMSWAARRAAHPEGEAAQKDAMSLPCIISQQETVGWAHAGQWGSGTAAASTAELAAPGSWELGSEEAG